MTILVTGGAGYIGSHTVCELIDKNEEVIILDDLSEGHASAIPDGIRHLNIDLKDRQAVLSTLGQIQPEAVLHFAAACLVGESMEDPSKYYLQNLVATHNLLDGMREAGTGLIVFSSTAAVYGEADTVPITELSRKAPVNTYGRTKLYCEQLLGEFHRAYGIRSISLRYFNAAGAHSSGEIGEDHAPETHLIPLVLKTALGLREDIKIFGCDYDTPDGTCIRDYIHVTDLANAHIRALAALREKRVDNAAYNLGTRKGYSVREVIEQARDITGQEIRAPEAPRRDGDPAVLVASSELAMKELGWEPEFSDMKNILKTAWNWHTRHPSGYAEPDSD